MYVTKALTRYLIKRKILRSDFPAEVQPLPELSPENT
jgi:hypothetical protein